MNKKIAIIINSLRRGGAEKVLSALINELHKDMEIHLFMFNTRQVEFEIPAGVVINQLGKPSSASAKPFDVLKLPFYAWKIRRYLKQKNIPLVFSFLNRPNFIAGYLKVFGYAGKTIINERTNTSYYYTSHTLGGRLGRFLVKKLYSKADCIITNSEYSKKELQKNFGLQNRMITIRNGIDVGFVKQQIENAVPPFKKEAGTFIFCHVGRFHPDKNQALLLKAFSQLDDPRCRLLLVGKDVPEQLTTTVQEMKLENKVILQDLQANIWPWYAISDAFVLSSNVEGFPNVLLEALASGLPVISTDCKWGPREILAPGTDYPAEQKQVEQAQNGLLVPVNDELLLAEAMRLLLNDASTYNHYQLRAKECIEGFHETRALENFTEIISFYLG